MLMSLYSTGISSVVKIRHLKFREDIENDAMVKDQMAHLCCLLVCTFRNFFAPVLVASHSVNNIVLSHEQIFENESYESD